MGAQGVAKLLERMVPRSRSSRALRASEHPASAGGSLAGPALRPGSARPWLPYSHSTRRSGWAHKRPGARRRETPHGTTVFGGKGDPVADSPKDDWA